MGRRCLVVVALLGLFGCAPMPAATTPRYDRYTLPDVTSALRRADNDFSPSGDPAGAPEAVPAAVQGWIRRAAGTRATHVGPAYVVTLPNRQSLYAVRCEGPNRAEYLLVVFDPASNRTSPDIARISLRVSPADPKLPTMHAPFLRAEDLDGDGHMELLVQGTWAVGSGSTSVVTRVFRLDDLRLNRVADFLTGDHFVWQKNPTGVWIIGDVRRAGRNGLQIDYTCHPLGRPDETRPIGQVAFRYSSTEGGYVESGAKIIDGTFSDFLRLDAPR